MLINFVVYKDENSAQNRTKLVDIHINIVKTLIVIGAVPVAEWVRSLYFSALNHSIISPLGLV